MTELELTCFGYLAPALVLRIARYPEPNGGAEILSSDRSIAGDGPLVASIGRGLGLQVGLVANRPAGDPAGVEARAFLDRHELRAELGPPAAVTPTAVILAQPDGTREWLVDFAGAKEELLAIAGDLIAASSLLYVDCYPAIAAAAARAIGIAGRSGVPVYLNVGDDAPGGDVLEAARGAEVAVVQASLHRADHSAAAAFAQTLRTRLAASAVAVTLGDRGATAVSGDGVAHASAREVDLDYAHGAGGAFAAGFAFGTLRDCSLRESLELACAVGSMQCSAERSEAPTEAGVRAFIARTRLAAS